MMNKVKALEYKSKHERKKLKRLECNVNQDVFLKGQLEGIKLSVPLTIEYVLDLLNSRQGDGLMFDAYLAGICNWLEDELKKEGLLK